MQDEYSGEADIRQGVQMLTAKVQYKLGVDASSKASRNLSILQSPQDENYHLRSCFDRYRNDSQKLS
jgi:hypothetical protein